MIKSIQVISSDSVNKKNMKFSTNSLFQELFCEPIPSLLNHDNRKIIGYMKTAGLLFTPNVTLLLGLNNSPETEDEFKLIKQYYLKKTTERLNKNINQKFVDDIKNKTSCNNNSLYFYHNECTKVQKSNILFDVFPFLKDLMDKDGLIPLEKIFEQFSLFNSNVFCRENYLIFPSVYFRRSYYQLNTLNKEFLSNLIKVYKNENNKVKIALDFDTIGYKSDYQNIFELDYWYGPKYNDDISTLKPGLTKHIASEETKLYHGIIESDFFWFREKNKITFECEEVNNNYMYEKERYGFKYIHSIFTNNELEHFDGAIRFYDKDNYKIRIESDMKKINQKYKPEYKKLFRIDGQLSINTWKDLIHDFHRGNELINEYFNKKESCKDMKKQVNEVSIDDFILIPSKVFNSNTFLSYISISDKIAIKSNDRLLRSDYYISHYNQAKKQVFDGFALEFIKFLKRKKVKYELVNDFTIHIYEELLSTLPIIYHDEHNWKSNLNDTFNVLKEFFIKQRDKNRIILYSIELPYSNKVIRIDFAANIEEHLKFFNSKAMKILIKNGVEEFIEKMKNYLKYKKAIPRQILRYFVNKDLNSLHFPRNYLKEYEIEYDEIQSKYLVVPKNSSINKKEKITIAAFEELKCGKCNEDYKICEHIASIDKNIYIIVKDMRITGIFYTDSPQFPIEWKKDNST